MSSIEWPAVDTNGVSFPAIVSSSDLFEGDIFGDELIDIYHSAVDAGSDPAGMENDIPQLPPTSGEVTSGEADEGTKIAMAAAEMDDGLGAFRPSTSFSDLTTLLPPATEGATVDSNSAKDNKKQTKKRSASVSSDKGPAAKRRAASGPVRRVSGSGAKKPSAPTPAAATAKRSGQPRKSDTPDPLSMKQKLAHPVSPTAGSVRETTKAASNGDSDFKTIAQAAVSTLMVNAASSKTDKPDKKVDTSTEHIKALTGNNWVAACADAVVPAATTVSSAGADNKANNRARRQNLTPDERARQNRDRNREHARNTRLRKKAYVEELKRTLTELVAQRDAAEFEKRQSAQREFEQREVRFRVIEEFLKLRGRNESNFARWAAILEDGFSLTLPLTSYRRSVESKTKTEFDQVVSGVSDVMADSSFFSEFLQSFGAEDDSKGAVTFQYQCDRSKFFMDSCNAVLEWTATSVNAKTKLGLKGIFRGKFSPASNKLVSASLSFDTARLSSKRSTPGSSDEVAAQAAASRADAILDSLQMPRISSSVPLAVNVVHSSSSSSEASASENDSEDESDIKTRSKAKVLPVPAAAAD